MGYLSDDAERIDGKDEEPVIVSNRTGTHSFLVMSCYTQSRPCVRCCGCSIVGCLSDAEDSIDGKDEESVIVSKRAGI